MSVETRWSQHIRDSQRQNLKNRPLYAAMRKYGIGNFSVETVEECDNPNERECYWIKHYNSFHLGYNATLGGEGSEKINKEELYQIWLKNNKCTIKELSQITHHDAHHLSRILKDMGKEIISGQEVAKVKQGKPVIQLSLDGNIIHTFSSIAEAEVSLEVPKGSSHISKVCNGKRKTYHGYKWKWQ